MTTGKSHFALSPLADMPTFGTVVKDATPKDWLYIDSLRKKEGGALGFIPKSVYVSILERNRAGGRARYLYSRLLVTVDNDDLTGFCYVSYAEQWAKIFQIVVQCDARRWHRALMMASVVEGDAERFGKQGVACRVAYDLESNWFWRAMGYTPVKQVISTWLNQRESKSRRPLWEYRKLVGDHLFNRSGGDSGTNEDEQKSS